MDDLLASFITLDSGPKKSNNSVTLEGPFGWCGVCSTHVPGQPGYCPKPTKRRVRKDNKIFWALTN
jgi:hypothetical protein